MRPFGCDGLAALGARARCYLTKGWPPTAIAAAARQSGATIVVMGAVSRSGIKRLIIGNAAEPILDELSCDLLVIEPKGFRTRLASAARGARLRMSLPTNRVAYF